MDALGLLDRSHILVAALLTAVGVWMAAGARPAWKRAAGVAIAHMGPAALLASGSAAGGEIAAAAALAGLSYMVLGLALTVRLQEDVGAVETEELDARDDAGHAGAPPAGGPL
jgi:hypothetical protein